MAEGRSGPTTVERGIPLKDLGLDGRGQTKSLKETLLSSTPPKASVQSLITPERRQAVRQFTKSTLEGRQARRETATQVIRERRENLNFIKTLQRLCRVKEPRIVEAFTPDQEVKKILQDSFERFSNEPNLLIEMPQFPPRIEQIKERKKYNQWVKEAGFKNIEEFYEIGFTPNQLREALDYELPKTPIEIDEERRGFNRKIPGTVLSPKLFGYIEGLNPDDKLPFYLFCESLRLPLDEQVFVQRKLAEAQFTIQKYLPVALPKEPSKLLIGRYSTSTNGEYIGSIRGTHYLALVVGVDEKTLVGGNFNPNLNPAYNPFRNPSIDMEAETLDAVIHELTHQTQAEVSNELTFSNPEILDQFTDEQIERFGPLDTTTNWIRYGLRMIRSPFNSLAPTIREGIAVLAEYVVLNQMIQDAENSGDLVRSKALRTVKRSRIGQQRDIRNDYLPGKYEEGMSYVEGPRIFKLLIQRFGAENIPELIKTINLEECDKIVRGTPEYQRILDDPRFIPGLERSPIVQESLTQARAA